MNFLAHAYLSFDDPGVLVGNMIGDFVKGGKLEGYSPAVQRGIRLHRAIDVFTDGHSSTRAARAFFKKDCGLYSGVFVDVVYDHFLGNDKGRFPGAGLPGFAEHIYQVLEDHALELPATFRPVLHYMKMQNWLYNYRLNEGVFRAFGGIIRRAKYLDDLSSAFRNFEMNYAGLGDCYRSFFPDLLAYATEYYRSHS